MAMAYHAMLSFPLSLPLHTDRATKITSNGGRRRVGKESQEGWVEVRMRHCHKVCVYASYSGYDISNYIYNACNMLYCTSPIAYSLIASHCIHHKRLNSVSSVDAAERSVLNSQQTQNITLRQIRVSANTRWTSVNGCRL